MPFIRLINSIKSSFWYSFTVFLLFASSQLQAQSVPDSVYISGKIFNLTGRLFREAPTVTFSRNNILVPNIEMVRNASIQADGSFRVALPLLFNQEEVYLSYGNKVFTTFLASPGTIEIVFNADSIFKAQRLFYFAGENAEANNQYTSYLAEENKVLRQNKRYGEDFQKHFWDAFMSVTARKLVEERVRLKRSAYETVARKSVPSEALQKWVYSLTKDEQAAYLLGHTLALNDDAETATLEEWSGIVKAPLTLQRIEWLLAIKNYLNREIDRAKTNGKQKTLRVAKIAELSAQFVTPLTSAEKQLLSDIATRESGSSKEISELTKIYERGPGILSVLTNYEVRKQAYIGEFKPEVEEYMNALFFAENSDLLLADERTIIYQYINKDIVDPTIKKALAEIYHLGMKDHEKVSTLLNQTITATPVEVKKDIWVAESSQSGPEWFIQVRQQLPQKPLYVTAWQLGDETSMHEMTFANELRMNSPEAVRFIYIHVVTTDNKRQRDLWKQYILKHDIKGIHLYMTVNQALNLAPLVDLYALPAHTFIRANGRVASQTPPPSAGVETVRFIQRMANR